MQFLHFHTQGTQIFHLLQNFYLLFLWLFIFIIFSFYYFYNILFTIFFLSSLLFSSFFSFIKIPLLLHPSLNIVTPLRPASHALIYILKTSSTVVSKGIFIVDDIEASIYFCHTFACLFFLHILYS